MIKPEDLLFPLYVKPKLNNKRIIAQSGAFLIYGARDYTSSTNPTPIPARSVFVPSSAKERIRQELETLGIHESTIFPDIERTSKFVTLRYQNALNDKANALILMILVSICYPYEKEAQVRCYLVNVVDMWTLFEINLFISFG